MKILTMLLLVIIALLSIAAGVAKVMGLPQEVQFLEGFGLNSMLIVLYGLAQIVGGILFAIPKTLRLGAIIIIVGFALSAALIALAGNYVFSLVSLLPIAITVFVLKQPSTFTHNG